MNGSNLFKELTFDEIHAIITYHFNAKEFTYSLLKGGMFNTTYLITISERDRYVLRVGPINQHLLLPFENNLMIAEKYFYQLCKEKEIPVPQIVHCVTDKKLIGRDYMISNFIENICFSSDNILKANKPLIYKQIGQIAKKINSIKGEKFGRLGDAVLGNGYLLWSDFIISEFSNTLTKLYENKLYTELEIENTKKVICKHIELLNEITQPSLIHADLWEGNILVSLSQKNVVAIIDADRAIWGDADFELASGWIINDYFNEGYEIKNSYSENSIVRKEIYILLYQLIDFYVYAVEYNNFTGAETAKKRVEALIKKL